MGDKRVLVAMSGGVDSSVAALLLREEGYKVSGVTMCLGVKGEGGQVRCCGQEAVEDARRVCGLLGIPHCVLDFSGDMERHVVGPFVEAYARGLTPNPCVECNRRLKFGSLLARAAALGFDRLATGHYAGLGVREGVPVVLRAADRHKDQSYFLWGIPADALGRILFPLARLSKDQVRERARVAGLPVAEKRESQDLCFVTGRSYAELVEERLGQGEPGDIVNSRGGFLGRHRGLHRFTVGQREGLDLGAGRPLYVLRKDATANILVVGTREETTVRSLVAGHLNSPGALPERAAAQIRHRSPEVPCRLEMCGSELRIEFDRPVQAAAPGQSVVLYEGEALVGGGTILETSWLGAQANKNVDNGKPDNYTMLIE